MLGDFNADTGPASTPPDGRLDDAEAEPTAVLLLCNLSLRPFTVVVPKIDVFDNVGYFLFFDELCIGVDVEFVVEISVEDSALNASFISKLIF